MRTAQLFSAALSLSSLASAWPWPQDANALKGVGEVQNMLVRRQNSGSSSVQATTARQTTSPAASGTASRSTSADDSTITASPSGSSGNDTDPTATYSTEYDPRLPAGGVSMITPNPFSGAQYYKIGDWVTLAWNYTSLSATPTAVNVYASCSANAATYTLAANMSVSDTNKVLWDTNDYPEKASNPLLTNQYTLIIADAAGGLKATPKAGYLAVQNNVIFGMYVKRPYTPLSEFNCATCNAAFSLHHQQALSFLVAMIAVSVGSFTWFASSFGIF